jgi:hypothetical protein
MALDATARETNFRDSMRKYLVDNLYTVEGYPVYFRQSFTTVVVSSSSSIEKWIVATFGNIYLDVMTRGTMELRPCTRNDTSRFKLAQMTDKIVGYLTPSSGDGITRIPFYQSAEQAVDWVEIGGIVVEDIYTSLDMVAEDETNFKVINVALRFASKL